MIVVIKLSGLRGDIDGDDPKASNRPLIHLSPTATDMVEVRAFAKILLQNPI